MNTQPLVSVPVITYNSAEYIIDGLESIKAQTYKNIELVISDDCSTDNTVEICRKWLDENKDRFVRTLLVTTEKNTGVAGNCNRAIRPCKGEWIKMLSGDDKFLPYTIEGYMEYVTAHPEVNICFAKLHYFGENEAEVMMTKEFHERNYYPKISQSDVERQRRDNLISLYVPGPGIFYKKSLWNNIGGFDEQFPFCEEDPFMVKIFELRERVYFINRELYAYRISSGSLCRENTTIISRHLRDRISYFRKFRMKMMIKDGLFLNAFDEYLSYMYIEAVEQKRYYLKYLFRGLMLFSPLRYIRKLHQLGFLKN